MHEPSTQRQVNESIRHVLDALRKPIVVFNEGWADTIPEWLKAQIQRERIVQLFHREEEKAARAEAVAYLYTASLLQPLSDEWTAIYCHLGVEYAHQRGITIPPDLASARLTPDQTRELNRLLVWIWRQSAIRLAPQKFRAVYDEQLTLF